MYEGTEAGVNSWLLFAVVIIGCIILIAIISRIETKYHKRFSDRNANDRVREVSAEGQQPEFVVGQVYQMEDGTLAKYAADGKFYKIKMEK